MGAASNPVHLCLPVPQDDKEYVGFATLPNQVHRKSVKKGFDFTLMVAGRKGQAGLGKAGQGASQAELMWLSEERMGEKKDKRQMAVPFL